MFSASPTPSSPFINGRRNCNFDMKEPRVVWGDKMFSMWLINYCSFSVWDVHYWEECRTDIISRQIAVWHVRYVFNLTSENKFQSGTKILLENQATLTLFISPDAKHEQSRRHKVAYKKQNWVRWNTIKFDDRIKPGMGKAGRILFLTFWKSMFWADRKKLSHLVHNYQWRGFDSVVEPLLGGKRS